MWLTWFTSPYQPYQLDLAFLDDANGYQEVICGIFLWVTWGSMEKLLCMILNIIPILSMPLLSNPYVMVEFLFMKIFSFFIQKVGEDDPKIDEHSDQIGENMGVSKNRGTPKSSILIGFSLPFGGLGVPLFLETPTCLYKCPVLEFGFSTYVKDFPLIGSFRKPSLHMTSVWRKTGFFPDQGNMETYMTVYFRKLELDEVWKFMAIRSINIVVI